jgi:tRNA pseudouridine38-40 synthase
MPVTSKLTGTDLLSHTSLSKSTDLEDRGPGIRRLALIVEYDGSNYAGFQLQAGQATIQGEIEKSLASFTGESIRIRGASRTDSGAHAKGQVVDFLTRSTHPVDYFPRAMNYYLPKDVQVLKAYDVAQEFNSRKDAVSRTYRYYILNRDWPSPLVRHTRLWVRQKLEVSRMAVDACSLVGKHDFRVFSAGFPPERSTVRRVLRWAVWKEEETIIIEAEANGFLRHQIRKANALLIEVGKGRLPEGAIDRALRGDLPGPGACPSIPARGLCLIKVSYSSTWPENEG